MTDSTLGFYRWHRRYSSIFFSMYGVKSEKQGALKRSKTLESSSITNSQNPPNKSLTYTSRYDFNPIIFSFLTID
ncbi:hypothetical protein L1987_03131 [Smallanthus sonchifolius]|uniref:Uncharacterized protein n=1 Tax=Smallanthus sonchifolius TaxID=185202 RepID=A0ACB9K9V6_9ASTR|nr:hypothetical protein L1987_03131 [Smallanthus sonchifolius]